MLCLQRRQWRMESSSDTAGFRISCVENLGSQLSLRDCDLSLEVGFRVGCHCPLDLGCAVLQGVFIIKGIIWKMVHYLALMRVNHIVEKDCPLPRASGPAIPSLSSSDSRRRRKTAISMSKAILVSMRFCENIQVKKDRNYGYFLTWYSWSWLESSSRRRWISLSFAANWNTEYRNCLLILM